MRWAGVPADGGPHDVACALSGGARQAAAHIAIEVDVLEPPIEGSLRADDGVNRRFVGYMQLVTAFENAVRVARGR